MWSPADISALPTAREVIDAKLAIEMVKDQLNDALLAVAQAQLRVEEIKKELFKRNAWIAPIRYLPFDVLSLIFEFCGKDDCKTPLVISEVSRHWRETVLATPRAWAFLRLSDFGKENQMIHRFFARSGHCPLHIYLPSSMDQPTQTLPSVEKRLKCLSIHAVGSHVEGRVFPILDRLTLRGYHETPTEISHFNSIQFPSLSHLKCEGYLTNSIGDSFGITKWAFPPLQTLSLQMTDDLAWLSLLTGVKNTLVSLRLYPIKYRTIPNPQITLPALKCLDIQFWLTTPPFWTLELVTPVLENYLEFVNRWPEEPLYHRDTQNVKKMMSDSRPNLSFFPLLEALQLTDEAHVYTVFAQLASNEFLSPNLQEVELATLKTHLTEQLSMDLLKLNQRRRVPVKLIISSRWVREIPYVLKTRPVCVIFSHNLLFLPDYQCGDKMPCAG